MNEYVDLLLPTDRTVEGPTVTVEQASTTINYDWEDDSGETKWARITFLGVVSLGYRDSSCLTVDDIGPSRSIVISDDSSYLEETTKRRAQMLQPQSDLEPDRLPRLRHFHVYFDDAAAIDVLATAMTVDHL